MPFIILWLPGGRPCPKNSPAWKCESKKGCNFFHPSKKPWQQRRQYRQTRLFDFVSYWIFIFHFIPFSNAVRPSSVFSKFSKFKVFYIYPVRRCFSSKTVDVIDVLFLGCVRHGRQTITVLLYFFCAHNTVGCDIAGTEFILLWASTKMSTIKLKLK